MHEVKVKVGRDRKTDTVVCWWFFNSMFELMHEGKFIAGGDRRTDIAVGSVTRCLSCKSASSLLLS